MNTDSNQKVHSRSAKRVLNLHSFWIGFAALGCAFLLEAGEVNLTYPFEVFLKGVIKDNAIIDDHLYTIKL
ncbi:hypothetical protein ACSX1A_15500 [Pontibacter sp. MBLB2868]|uniref:hypothetical protein n=1 Tax=Pontibacter sp. MBLB2868 TaxID=3451555 RepID=UPI003F74C66B